MSHLTSVYKTYVAIAPIPIASLPLAHSCILDPAAINNNLGLLGVGIKLVRWSGCENLVRREEPVTIAVTDGISSTSAAGRPACVHATHSIPHYHTTRRQGGEGSGKHEDVRTHACTHIEEGLATDTSERTPF